jgi:hypothetical protein
MVYNPFIPHVIKVPGKYSLEYAIRRFNLFKGRWEYHGINRWSKKVEVTFFGSDLDVAIRTCKELKFWNFKISLNLFHSPYKVVDIKKKSLLLKK